MLNHNISVAGEYFIFLYRMGYHAVHGELSYFLVLQGKKLFLPERFFMFAAYIEEDVFLRKFCLKSTELKHHSFIEKKNPIT